MKKQIFRSSAPYLILIFSIISVSFTAVESVEMVMTIQSLSQGKVITIKGKIYYRVANGLMVT